MADNRTAPVFTPAGKANGEVALDPAVFGLEPNVALMHQVVTAQLAAARSGTASSAATEGVAARRSPANSESVTSVSWPTPTITGVRGSSELTAGTLRSPFPAVPSGPARDAGA